MSHEMLRPAGVAEDRSGLDTGGGAIDGTPADVGTAVHCYRL